MEISVMTSVMALDKDAFLPGQLSERFKLEKD